uniref:Uncharacterized protein n=1 Tax=Panagrolaimus sp. PS1159 TaxID=55785 RepID=A0AC35GMQ8_9BILA
MGTRNEIYKRRQQYFSQSLPANGTTPIEDEEFADANNEMICNNSLNLLDTINETKIALELFLNNEFELAEERMACLSDQSMYHALGYSTILFIKAMMTCDRSDMEKAMESSNISAKVIEKFRPKYTIADSIYRFGGSHKPLTDSEIHAELCYAESLMFRAVLTFFYDETFASFVKGAFKIRSCYQSFKECQRILLTENWSTRDPEIKSQFEAGVRMGIGAFNLMLSTLPSKIIKLLEIIGFNGNKVSEEKNLF